ncbi:MAG: hypothetical protein IRZ08_22900 [Frankia sp.]|nr:hypothetical protein [Frankia sp.]
MTRTMPAELRLSYARAISAIGQDTGAWAVIQVLHAANLAGALQAAYAAVDQDAVFAEERARLTARAWDGEEPINGVSADQVRASHGIGEAMGAYLIEQDGRVLIFQPVPGVTDTQELDAAAQAHADQIAAARAHERIVNAIKEALLEV